MRSRKQICYKCCLLEFPKWSTKQHVYIKIPRRVHNIHYSESWPSGDGLLILDSDMYCSRHLNRLNHFDQRTGLPNRSFTLFIGSSHRSWAHEYGRSKQTEGQSFRIPSKKTFVLGEESNPQQCQNNPNNMRVWSWQKRKGLSYSMMPCM